MVFNIYIYICKKVFKIYINNSLLELQFLCGRLLHREDSNCCCSTGIQCWLHGLKNVIIEKSGGNGVEMPLDQDTLFDELDKEKEIHFKLLW